MAELDMAKAPSRGGALNVALWIAQFLVFAAFVTFGSMKLFMPVDRLAAMWHWPGEVPRWVLYGTGVIDIAGGLGILLPAATKIYPRLSIIAAVCILLLQVCATIFHLSRGEAAALPVNAVIVAFVLFVLWGRTRRA